MSRPREIKDVLQKVLPGLKPKGGKVIEKLQVAWREITGEKEAGQSRIKQLKSGILLVEVDSAPMMHYISTRNKQELLKRLNERIEGVYIKEIRMRLAKE